MDTQLSIKTDREALEALGLNEQQAANILGRRRQALNAALGKGSTRKGYFTAAELLILCLAAKGRGIAVNEQALAAYIRACETEARGAQEGAQAARDFLTRFGAISTLEPSAFEEIWILLPNALYLHAEATAFWSEIVDLPRAAPNARLVYLCGSELDEGFLEDDLKRSKSGEMGFDSGRVVICSESLISALMPMVIGDPRSRGKTPVVYAAFEKGALRVPYVDGARLGAHVSKHVHRLRKLKPIGGQGEEEGREAEDEALRQMAMPPA